MEKKNVLRTLPQNTNTHTLHTRWKSSGLEVCQNHTHTHTCSLCGNLHIYSSQWIFWDFSHGWERSKRHQLFRGGNLMLPLLRQICRLLPWVNKKWITENLLKCVWVRKTHTNTIQVSVPLQCGDCLHRVCKLTRTQTNSPSLEADK